MCIRDSIHAEVTYYSSGCNEGGEKQACASSQENDAELGRSGRVEGAGEGLRDDNCEGMLWEGANATVLAEKQLLLCMLHKAVHSSATVGNPSHHP